MIRLLNILLLLLLTTSLVCGSIQQTKVNNNEQAVQMKNIEFIPKEFNDVELGLYETNENKCSPKFRNEMRTINSISINVPQQIISNASIDKSIFIIPVCVIYSISLRRGLKYNHLSAKILHIKNLDEDSIYSGEIIDKELQYEHPLLPPHYAEMEKERMKKVEEAQKYSDEELEQEGLAAVNRININLMEYVDVPFKAGRYEVYMSFLGLESNRAIVEIIEK